MRCLITISSCHDFEVNGNNDVLRRTWLSDLPVGVDYKFVIGQGQGGEFYRNWKKDYLPVACPDGYNNLTYKTRASHSWAWYEGYDFVFQCFPDTYVVPGRLMTCGFENHDYHGDFRGEGRTSEELSDAQDYASGGAGYWLSRRACGVLKSHPILGVWRDEILTYAEDMWVGNVLGAFNKRAINKLIYFDDTQRFMNRGEVASSWPRSDNEYITSHLSCGVTNSYDPRNMLHAHSSWKRSHEQFA